MVHQTEVVLPLLILPPKIWWEHAAQPGVRIGLGESFPKQTFRNRIRLSTGISNRTEGEFPYYLDFSIPMRHDPGRTARTARTDDSVKWRHLLWKTLQTHWAPLPFWEILSSELEPLIRNEEPIWHAYVLGLNRWMAEQWGSSLPPITDERPTVDFSPKSGICAGEGGISWCEALFREGPALYL